MSSTPDFDLFANEGEDGGDTTYIPDEDLVYDDWQDDEYERIQPKLGVVYQTHQDNQSFDDDEFWRQLEWAQNNMERDEPGDMATRGPWRTEGDFMWRPYSQFSCAYGECIINRQAHLDKARNLVQKHGRIFIFTIVDSTLLEAAKARPTEFVPLCTTASWMNGNSVVLFAAVHNSEAL
jgi:hypothetical protein